MEDNAGGRRAYAAMTSRIVPRRILLYGFGPYRRFPDNVSEQALRRVAKRPGLRKLIFPVRFHRRQFIEAVERFCPDLIIGLGQCSRGKLLRVETRAVNRRRNGKNEKHRPIFRNGAPDLYANFRADFDGRSRVSRYAGDYVCNYSMYVILRYLQQRRLPVQYGFIHIPRGFDPKSAALCLENALD
jgi:pyroglutamyl-peptidase